MAKCQKTWVYKWCFVFKDSYDTASNFSQRLKTSITWTLTNLSSFFLTMSMFLWMKSYKWISASVCTSGFIKWVQDGLKRCWFKYESPSYFSHSQFTNLRDKEGLQKNLLWVQLVKKLGYSSALFLRPLCPLTLKRKTSHPVKTYQKAIHCLHIEQKCFLLTPRSIRGRVPCRQGFKPKRTKTSVVK